MIKPIYAVIDVAKSSFEVAVTVELQTLNLGNDEAGHVEPCQVFAPPALGLVLQATGE